MPKTKKKLAYSKADMKSVSDNPKWTKKDFANAKPFAEVFPELAKTISRRGPQVKPTKIPVNIRLSPEVLEHFKAKGQGWQTAIDDVLVSMISKKPAKKSKPATKKKTVRRAA